MLAVLAVPPRQAGDAATHLAYRRWCRILIQLAHEEGAEWSSDEQFAVPADVAWPLDDALRALPRLRAKVIGVSLPRMPSIGISRPWS